MKLPIDGWSVPQEIQPTLSQILNVPATVCNHSREQSWTPSPPPPPPHCGLPLPFFSLYNVDDESLKATEGVEAQMNPEAINRIHFVKTHLQDEG